MTNQPDRYERFVVPPGTKKVEYCVDTKMANAATFTIQREDHTVGNVIRMKLHEDKNVWFAGYKIPHPLEHRLVIKVRTNGSSTPVVAYNTAIDECVRELQVIKNEFKKQVQELCDAEGAKADFEPHERFTSHLGAGPGDYGGNYGDTGEPYNDAVGDNAYGGGGFQGDGYAAMDTGYEGGAYSTYASPNAF